MEGEVEVDVIFLRFVKKIAISLHWLALFLQLVYLVFTFLNGLLLSAQAFVLNFS